MGTPLWAALAAFALALAFVRALWTERLATLVLDIPNDRSLHARPVPRTGGVGLMAAVAVVVGGLAAGPAAIAVPALVLAALFLVDDVRGLSVGTRFTAQFAAAAAFLWAGGPFPWLLWPLLAVGIVWSTNLYNFMDGSNGLAGGMTVIGFAAYALAAHAAGAPDLALLAAVVAGAAAGFLVWNFDPARIFLGDAGSIPLGFLAATIGIAGWQRGLWPFWFPGLVFSVFVVDSGLTLLKRLLHRENPFQAHRSHYYQRLIRMGWSHRRLALNAYMLMAMTSGSAMALREAAPVAAGLALAGWAVALALVVAKVDARWRASPARRDALERAR
jgi:UDP-N-acetylmuramyl pentapeptide phosphotransferase/UDP-N-acetylglucosamine-1-phosphate transferase